MKNFALAVATALATLLAVSSFAAASPEQSLERTGKVCEDCAKANEPCTGGVRCCDGLSCVSASGGDPKCVER